MTWLGSSPVFPQVERPSQGRDLWPHTVSLQNYNHPSLNFGSCAERPDDSSSESRLQLPGHSTMSFERAHSRAHTGLGSLPWISLVGGTRRGSDLLCWSSRWIEKAGFLSECGRTFRSLLRISRGTAESGFGSKGTTENSARGQSLFPLQSGSGPLGDRELLSRLLLWLRWF